MSSSAPVVLLTWNPGSGNTHVWSPHEWREVMVEPHRAGKLVRTTWGVARHRIGIAPGVPVLLYRQGDRGRGLVARGVLESGPWPDPVAAERGRPRNLVDVAWSDSVPVADALGVDDLELVAPTFAWRKVYASGRAMPHEASRAVLRAWEEHLVDVHGGPRSPDSRVARGPGGAGL